MDNYADSCPFGIIIHSTNSDSSMQGNLMSSHNWYLVTYAPCKKHNENMQVDQQQLPHLPHRDHLDYLVTTVSIISIHIG